MFTNRRRSRAAQWSATAATLLAVLAFGGLSPATASDGSTAPITAAETDPVTSDVATVAAQLGISHDEAVDLGDAQAAFAALAEAASLEFPTGYVASEWTAAGGVITVQADVEDEVRQMVERAGIDASVTVSAAPSSIAQEEAQLALVEAIYDAIQVPFSSHWNLAAMEPVLQVEVTADRATLEDAGVDLDEVEGSVDRIAAQWGGVASVAYGSAADRLAAGGALPDDEVRN